MNRCYKGNKMYYDAVSVKYCGDYQLEVEFVTGEKGVVDLSNIKRNGIFSRFNDMDYFKSVYIHEDVLTWPPGDLDIAPETIYSMATGKPISDSIEENMKTTH